MGRRTCAVVALDDDRDHESYDPVNVRERRRRGQQSAWNIAVVTPRPMRWVQSRRRLHRAASSLKPQQWVLDGDVGRCRLVGVDG